MPGPQRWSPRSWTGPVLLRQAFLGKGRKGLSHWGLLGLPFPKLVAGIRGLMAFSKMFSLGQEWGSWARVAKGKPTGAGRSSTGSPQRGRGQQKWPPLPRRLLWAKSWAWSPRAVPWGKHHGRLGTWSSVMTLEEGLRPKEPGRSGAQPSLLWAGRSQHPGRARAGRTPLRVVCFLDAPVTLQNVGAARATTACLGQPSFWASARSCRIRTRGESDQGQRPVFLQLGPCLLSSGH